MSSQAFKPPLQKKEKVLQEKHVQPTYIKDSASSTEEIMSADGMDSDIEYLIKEEAQLWLATHGPKLFALEASKYLAAESKRKNIKGKR